MKILLSRSVNNRERYYCLELIANLFDEYLLVRTYGGCTSDKPTRIIYQSFENYISAYGALESVIMKKEKRGYVPKKKELL